MEGILTPQITFNVDDAPLELNIDPADEAAPGQHDDCASPKGIAEDTSQNENNSSPEKCNDTEENADDEIIMNNFSEEIPSSDLFMNDILTPQMTLNVDDTPLELNMDGILAPQVTFNVGDALDLNMEEMLAPQVAMEVDDAPLELNIDPADEVMPEQNDEHASPEGIPEQIDQNEANPIVEKCNGAGDKTVTDDSSDVIPFITAEEQIPVELNEEELSVKHKLFGLGQTAVQFLRHHCTGCNEHLGSAPNNQKNRYVHPLLKVLLCKKCYEFYSSGEFETDEDGSELYCRWCGQGGNVLCCVTCPFVFCKKCIRNNLGKRKLNAIKESEDWLCFACDPVQIINLRVICRTLYDYTQEQLQFSETTKNPVLLGLDYGVCCQNKANVVNAGKRKSTTMIDSENSTDDVYIPKKKKRPVSLIKKALTANNVMSHQSLSASLAGMLAVQEEDEVICTPDLSLLMEEEDTPQVSPFLPMGPAETPSSSGSSLLIPRSEAGFSTLPSQAPSSLSVQQQQNSVHLIIPFIRENSEHQFVDRNAPRLNPFAARIQNNLLSSIRPKFSASGVPGTSKAPKKVFVRPKMQVLHKTPVILNTSTNRPLTSGNVRRGAMPGALRLQHPNVKFVSNNPVIKIPATSNQSSTPRLVPGLKHEWFHEAATLAGGINQTLSTKMATLSVDQSEAASVEQLATVHNQLQEVLSNSINALIQVRKNLRAKFMDSLHTLKFCQVSIDAPRPAVEDNDVIIVDSNNDDAPTSTNGLSPESLLQRSTGYLKVKPLAELFNCPVQEPKAATPGKPSNVQSAENSCNSDDVVIVDDAPMETTPQGQVESNQNKLLDLDDDVNLNDETMLLIKKAIAESKFEKLIDDNMKTAVKDIPVEDLKKMLSVRVIVETKFGRGTPRTSPKKCSKALNVFLEAQDIEEMLNPSIVVNKRKLLDYAIAKFKAKSDALKNKQAQPNVVGGLTEDTSAVLGEVPSDDTSSQGKETPGGSTDSAMSSQKNSAQGSATFKNGEISANERDKTVDNEITNCGNNGSSSLARINEKQHSAVECESSDEGKRLQITLPHGTKFKTVEKQTLKLRNSTEMIRPLLPVRCRGETRIFLEEHMEF